MGWGVGNRGRERGLVEVLMRSRREKWKGEGEAIGMRETVWMVFV